MSENSQESTVGPFSGPQETGTPESETDANSQESKTDEFAQLPADHPLVTALERQKAENKTLRERAAKLDEIEEAQKTEAEKAADRLAAAEQRTADLTARAARLELALEYRLSKDDAALLEGVTDPDALQRLAQRLAVKAEESRGPKPDPNQGRQSRGPATTADLFAAAVESQFR